MQPSQSDDIVPYEFSKLKDSESIRIFCLQKSVDSFAPLECEILHKKLEDVENQFEAISYACGEYKPSVVLHCGNDQQLLITENLASALRRLRLPDHDRYLWADAVSIHQDDAEEKSKQVAFMSSIFSSSTRTLAWLGESDDSTATALAFCQRLADQRVSLWHTGAGGAELEEKDRETFEKRKAILRNTDEGIPLAGLFARPFFKRRWVIQEAVLARDLIFYCGSYSMHWRTLLNALRLIRNLQRDTWKGCWIEQNRKSYTKPLNIMELRRGRASTPVYRDGIFSLLRWHSEAQCVDPRDKVYAFLGLAIDMENFKADYTENVEALCVRLVEYLLFDQQDLLCLSLPHRESRRKQATSPSPSPSPTPTPSSSSKANKFLTKVGLKRSSHESEKQRKSYAIELHKTRHISVLARVPKPRYFAATNEDVLIKRSSANRPSIRGLLFDTIKTQSDFGPSHAWDTQMRSIILNWPDVYVKTFRQGKEQFYLDSAVTKKFARTIVADNRQHEGYTRLRESQADSDDLLSKTFMYWREYLQYGNEKVDQVLSRYETGFENRVIPEIKDADVVRDMYQYCIAVTNLSQGRCGIFTESGSIGFAPSHTQAGDVVVVFTGAQTPHVLRPQLDSKGDEVYELVGECYVHGIMDGEAFDSSYLKTRMFDLI